MNTNDYGKNNPRNWSDRVGALMLTVGEQNLDFPRELDLLPMMDLNIFPHLIYPITVEDMRARPAVRRCLGTERPIALFAVKDSDVNPYDIKESDFYPIGLAVLIHKIWDIENGNLKVMVQGLARIKMVSLLGEEGVSVKVEPILEEQGDQETLRPLILEAKRLFGEIVEKSPNMAFNSTPLDSSLNEKPGIMADVMMAALPLKGEAKIEFLSIVNVEARLLKLLEYLTLEIADLEAGRAVGKRMKENIDKRHREMHLREQLKAIEAELGEGGEDNGDDLRKLADKIHAKALPNEVREIAEREIRKLKKSSPHNSEYSVIYNYLELILALPWKESTFDRYDLTAAKKILERDHHGMEKIKKRIVEYLAVRKLTGGARSPILCLVGPPGVGKTSLGRSFAKALGREFVRLSLGGVRDEAEIRGHRRTYVGALPGRIIAGLKKAKSNNPVFLLDELDKMVQNGMSDPAAALLEVLDPEQNNTFSDHYLELPFDLSNVLFILTANVLENIPGPLRDRLEIVELSGYTLEEKTEIAKKHLLPKELERHGLVESDLIVSDEILSDLIESYTREAGVRELTRHLGAMARSVAVKKAEGLAEERPFDQAAVKAALGTPRFQREFKAAAPQKGVVTGLAWTAAGGDILFIEAAAMPGKGQLTLTGQLGDVMQESAKAAISYVRSHAFDWNLDPDWFNKHDVHLHLPQGAIPKDGPSAGVTLATAIVSLVGGWKVRPEVAMTGEISLRGLVLPVGGVKEKLLAAKRAGISQILIPEKNLPDLMDMPDHLLNGVTVTTIATLDDALAVALLKGKGARCWPSFEGGLSVMNGDQPAACKNLASRRNIRFEPKQPEGAERPVALI